MNATQRIVQRLLAQSFQGGRAHVLKIRPINSRNVTLRRFFSGPVLRQNVRSGTQVTGAGKKPSPIEVAYLQQLLKEAGITVPESVAFKQPSTVSRLKWLTLGFLLGPITLMALTWIVDELVLNGWEVTKDAKLQERLVKQAKAKRAVSAEDTSNVSQTSNQSKTSDQAAEPVGLARLSERTTELETELLKAKTTAMATKKKLQELHQVLRVFDKLAVKLHKHVINMCAMGSNPSIILDDALLDSRPVTLSTGRSLGPSEAALIRVLDETGKNSIIILAVDVHDEKDLRDAASVAKSEAQWDKDCYGLHTWMFDLVDELHRTDSNSSRGVETYCVAEGILVNVGKRNGSRAVIRYDLTEVQPGFPLRQLRQVGSITSAWSNLVNKTSLQNVEKA